MGRVYDRGGRTRILGIFGTDVLVAGIQHVFVHERRTRRHLTEEADFDGLADLDSLPFLDKNLSCVFASVLSIQAGHAVLFWMMAFFEWLQCGHEVVSTCYSRCDDSFCDPCSDSSFDNGGDRIHRTDDLCLELRWDVQLDLLEEIL